MKKHLSFLFALSLIFACSLSPLAPVHKAEAEWVTSQAVSSADVPMWLYIPSINLFSYVEGMGIDNKGNMDVPSGRTNNVGWYKYGVLPGEMGTAVLDAHNTAAFKNLHALEPGSDIYIVTSAGRMLHFTAQEAETYAVEALSPDQLFEKTDSKQINLITCAGTLLGNGEATHRLIVSAELAHGDITSSSIGA